MAVGEATSIERQAAYGKPSTVPFSVATNGTFTVAPNNPIPWGFVAIAGLAGLFYDKCLLKLQEVFMTVFNPQDNRGGKLGGLAITTTSLRGATVGQHYDVTLEARGGQGQLTWSVQPTLPADLSLDPATGVIQGTPKDAASSRQYTFTAMDEKGVSAQAKLALEVGK